MLSTAPRDGTRVELRYGREAWRLARYVSRGKYKHNPGWLFDNDDFLRAWDIPPGWRWRPLRTARDRAELATYARGYRAKVKARGEWRVQATLTPAAAAELRKMNAAGLTNSDALSLLLLEAAERA
jgi:hypothetical protein